jgi:tripartite-type tricarboxylate transporter receptor subunit TctC
LPLAATAQSDYPSKPVKIIVPFPAGGTSDVMGRLVAEELGKILKQPFIVENVGGAGGVIGTERGAKAAPDGYTLIQTGGQRRAHNLSLPKYNSNTDFIHICRSTPAPTCLVPRHAIQVAQGTGTTPPTPCGLRLHPGRQAARRWTSSQTAGIFTGHSPWRRPHDDRHFDPSS